MCVHTWQAYVVTQHAEYGQNYDMVICKLSNNQNFNRYSKSSERGPSQITHVQQGDFLSIVKYLFNSRDIACFAAHGCYNTQIVGFVTKNNIASVVKKKVFLWVKHFSLTIWMMPQHGSLCSGNCSIFCNRIFCNIQSCQ